MATLSCLCPSTPTAFTWSYEAANTLNLDGLPNTSIFLNATYANGTVRRVFVATTPGGCNDLPDAAVDSVPGSTRAQCYAAGLGYHFKVTKGETAYQIEQKKFEEALPDYTPPVYLYEIVATLPF